MYRRVLLITLALLIGASSIVTVLARRAYAETPQLSISKTALDASRLSTVRNSVAMCMGYNGGQALAGGNPQDIAAGKWFWEGTQVREWFAYNDGKTDCSKINLTGYLKDLGFTGNIQAACELGWYRSNKSDCLNGDGDFDIDRKLSKQSILDKIDKTYKGSSFGKDFTAEQYYAMAAELLTNSRTCKAEAVVATSAATPDQKNSGLSEVQVVDSTGAVTPILYKINGDGGKDWQFRNNTGGDTGYIEEKCGGLIRIMSENVAAYSDWLKKNQPGSDSNPGTCAEYAKSEATKTGKPANETKIADACNAGSTNKSNAEFCDKTYPKAKDATTNAACIYGRDKAASAASDSTTGQDEESCGIEGVGWIVCPVMNFLAALNDKAYNYLSSSFLSVDKELLGSSTEAAWKQFRDIANTLFIVALLVIIFSQISSLGISNYGIKRMLPRLIITAILVNTSLLLCRLAVDMSNLIGYGIVGFFSLPIDQALKTNSPQIDIIGGGLTAAGIVTGVVAGAVGIATAISVPVILAALLALSLIVLMLAGRQAVIVLLVVASPIAFMAYLLPNTEQIFKKWYKMFYALLLLFPEVGFVFGASRLASHIIANSGGQSEKEIVQLIALAVACAPFFIIPSLLKGSLAATGALGAKLQGMSNKATGRVGARVKDSSKLGTGLADMKQYKNTQRAKKYAAKRGSGIMGVVGRAPIVGGGKRYNAHARNRASDLAADERAKDIAAYDRGFAGMDSDSVVEIANNKNLSTEQRAAAVQRVFRSGSYDDKKKIMEAASSGGYFTDASDGWARDMLANEYAKSSLTAAYGTSPAGSLTTGAAFDTTKAVRENYGNLDSTRLTSHPNAARDIANAYGDANEDQQKAVRQAMSQLEQTPEQMSKLTPDAIKSLQKIDPNFGNRSTSPDTESSNSSSNSPSVPSAPSSPIPTPPPPAAPSAKPQITPSAERSFTRDQIKTMGPDNVQAAVDKRGGMEAMSDGDVLSIRNNHDGHEVGQTARDEAIRRGLVTPPNRQNLP